jgi:hypothetical protein
MLFGVFGASITILSAQSRLSIAPTYWFNYNPYSYQFDFVNNGLKTQTQVAGHSIVSSLGLTARYHFTPQWNVSVGLLHYRKTFYSTNSASPQGKSKPFTKGGQVLVLVNYRLTNRHLSPYFSAGAIFAKGKPLSKVPLQTEGVVGAGLDYRFHSGLSLLLQPTFSYPFSRPVNGVFIQISNYSSNSLGLQTQLIGRF